jgi:protein TonB
LIFESDERDASVWPMSLAVAASFSLHAGLLFAFPDVSETSEKRLSQLAIEVTLDSAVAPPVEPAPSAAMAAGQERPQGSIDLVQTAPMAGPTDAAIPVQPPPPLEAVMLEDTVPLAEAPPTLAPRELVSLEATADARSRDVLDRVQAPPTPQPVRQAPPRPESRDDRAAVVTASPPGERRRLSDVAAYASRQEARQDYVLQVVRKLSNRQFVATDRKGTAGGVVVARLTVGRDGALVDLSLAKDSGSIGVDGSILENIRKAAPFAPLPREFGQGHFTFIVPINFAQER